MSPTETNCYCGSNNNYENCCLPFHNQSAKPETAEQLMRSRYSACCLKKVDYLLATTWPPHQNQLDASELSSWLDRTHWHQLTIVQTTQGQSNNSRGTVQFKASFSEPPSKVQQEHDEHSDFIKEKEQWYFIHPGLTPLPPAVSVTVGRNDPCPCGSGKKFKKCCM
ncbi:YchJ family protein [Spongorhabdus nitratireducens]